MTLHSFYDHKCSKCGEPYIPYDKEVSCPKCGIVEEERFDFVPLATASLVYNLENYGSYLPPAWGESSIGDYLLLILFQLFAEFSCRKRKKDFLAFTEKWLSKIDWGERKHIEKYILSMAVRVNEELQKTLEVRNYKKLEQYFANSQKTVEVLTLKDIEGILGFELPEEAYHYRRWWANIRKGCHTHVWLNVGWKVDGGEVGKNVTFRKVEGGGKESQ